MSLSSSFLASPDISTTMMNSVLVDIPLGDDDDDDDDDDDPSSTRRRLGSIMWSAGNDEDGDESDDNDDSDNDKGDLTATPLDRFPLDAVRKREVSSGVRRKSTNRFNRQHVERNMIIERDECALAPSSDI